MHIVYIQLNNSFYDAQLKGNNYHLLMSNNGCEKFNQLCLEHIAKRVYIDLFCVSYVMIKLYFSLFSMFCLFVFVFAWPTWVYYYANKELIIQLLTLEKVAIWIYQPEKM